MRKILLLIAFVLVTSTAFADKPTSWDKVQQIEISTVLVRQPDNTFVVTIKTKAKALSDDGGAKVLKDKTVVNNGAAYTLKQIWNNWNVLSGLEKTEFKNIIMSAIGEDVE